MRPQRTWQELHERLQHGQTLSPNDALTVAKGYAHELLQSIDEQDSRGDAATAVAIGRRAELGARLAGLFLQLDDACRHGYWPKAWEVECANCAHTYHGKEECSAEWDTGGGESGPAYATCCGCKRS